MEKFSWDRKEPFSFEELVEIVSVLRSPNGCPWDRQQTHKSLRNNFVEEAYEVCEGIDRNDSVLLCEELGDVMLQILFHADIAKDDGTFSLAEVIDGVARKMIRRHMHVFGEEEASDWEEIKRKEKGEETLYQTLDRISTSLPALKRAEKFIKKGAPDPTPSEDPLFQKGEALYHLCCACREETIDPEEALNQYLNNILKKCTNCE